MVRRPCQQPTVAYRATPPHLSILQSDLGSGGCHLVHWGRRQGSLPRWQGADASQHTEQEGGTCKRRLLKRAACFYI